MQNTLHQTTLGYKDRGLIETMYVNHDESELSARFKTRCISVYFARLRPCMFKVYTTHAMK